MAAHYTNEEQFVYELRALIENKQYADVIQACIIRYESSFDVPISILIIWDYALCMTGDYQSTHLHLVNQAVVLEVTPQLRILAGECCLALGSLQGARQWLWHSPWSMDKRVRLMLAATLARLGHHAEATLVLSGMQDTPATLQPAREDSLWCWESFLWLCLWQAVGSDKESIYLAVESLNSIGDLISDPRFLTLREILVLLASKTSHQPDVDLLSAVSDKISQQLMNCLSPDILKELLTTWSEYHARGCLEFARYLRQSGDSNGAFEAYNSALTKARQVTDRSSYYIMYQARFEIISASVELGHFEVALQVIDTMGLPAPKEAMEAAVLRQEYSTPDEMIPELEGKCDHNLWLLKAKAYAGLAQWPEAMQAAEIALEGSRNESETQAGAILAAQIALFQCDYRKGLTFIKDALKVWADDPTIHLSKAVCEMNLGLNEDAWASLQTYIDQPNLAPDGLFRVGRMFASLDDHKTAEQFYRRATSILLQGPALVTAQPEIPFSNSSNEMDLPLPVAERTYKKTTLTIPVLDPDLFTTSGNTEDLKHWLANELGDVWEQLSPQSRKALFTAELQLRNRYTPDFDFSLPMLGLFKVIEIELSRGLFTWLQKHGVGINEQRLTLDSMLLVLQGARTQEIIGTLPPMYQSRIQGIVQFIGECLDNYRMNEANNFGHMMGWAFESLRHSLLKAGWLAAIVDSVPYEWPRT